MTTKKSLASTATELFEASPWPSNLVSLFEEQEVGCHVNAFASVANFGDAVIYRMTDGPSGRSLCRSANTSNQ